MSDFTLNQLAANINEANVAKGFYEEYEAIKMSLTANAPSLLNDFERLFFAQRIALITSEASEALEANRKDKKIKVYERDNPELMLDGEFEIFFKHNVKDTQEDEIADILIRLLDLAGHIKMDLDSHVDAKLRYNSLRAHKHGKKY